MSYLMGIDLGSTSLKAVVYDLEGNIVASGSRPTERSHPDADNPEWTVWMPEMIWGGVTASIRDAVAQLDDRSQIKAVAVAGMGGDGVPLDENGRWLYPFISWLCPRTAPQLAWWEKTIGADKTFAVGGNMMWTFSSALRVLWMQEHEPEILKRTAKWALIEDFVNFMLSGVYATDYSMASTTFLFDQTRRTWSDEMLGKSGIDKSLWCDPKPSGTVLGEVHDEAANATGLPAGTPVVLGGHDFMCGALPVGAFEPGVVLDVTGTWEVVMTPTAEPVLTEDVRNAGVMVESHVAKDTWGPWGGAVASEMLEWYFNQYGDATPGLAQADDKGDKWSALMAEAEATPVGAGGAMFMPHMSGAGTPIVDPASRGAFVGLQGTATRGHLCRAIIEGLNYQFLDIVNTMETCFKQQFERFIAVGGVVRNDFWMQNKTDVIGRPLEIPDVEEATALGAAILAGMGVGLYKDEQDALDHVHRPGAILEPNAEAHKQYRDGYDIFRSLHAALKDVSHRISGQR